MHIGSQITELAPFDDAFALLADFVRALRADGHAISHVDLGGGLGIPYREDNEPPPTPQAYAEVVKRATRDLGCRLIFEPGRLIVGNAGILVTRVLYLKRGEAKTFVIVDAAMNDLIRPTLYEAHHEIRPVREPRRERHANRCRRGRPGLRIRRFSGARPRHGRAASRAICWPSCRPAPMARSRPAPTTPAPLVPEVLVRDGEWALVRPRLEVDELIALDRLPPWL